MHDDSGDAGCRRSRRVDLPVPRIVTAPRGGAYERDPDRRQLDGHEPRVGGRGGPQRHGSTEQAERERRGDREPNGHGPTAWTAGRRPRRGRWVRQRMPVPGGVGPAGGTEAGPCGAPRCRPRPERTRTRRSRSRPQPSRRRPPVGRIHQPPPGARGIHVTPTTGCGPGTGATAPPCRSPGASSGSCAQVRSGLGGDGASAGWVSAHNRSRSGTSDRAAIPRTVGGSRQGPRKSWSDGGGHPGDHGCGCAEAHGALRGRRRRSRAARDRRAPR
jgi:hypothetical protein